MSFQMWPAPMMMKKYDENAHITAPAAASPALKPKARSRIWNPARRMNTYMANVGSPSW